MGVFERIHCQKLILLLSWYCITGSRGQSLNYAGENLEICNENGTCKTFKQDSVNCDNTGLFTTLTEHEHGSGVPYEPANVIDDLIFPSKPRCDCCKTILKCTYYHQLTNTANELCYIIQLPSLGIFQHQTIGLCVDNNACVSGGACRQQYAWITLLAWCPSSGLKLSFSVFPIKSFCDCK